MEEQQDRLWRSEHAKRFSVIVDAERYFEVARVALLQARSRIMLIGWDFDARIRLNGDERGEREPATVGEFLYWLVERTPTLELYLLRWDVGAFSCLTSATSPNDWLTTSCSTPKARRRCSSRSPSVGCSDGASGSYNDVRENRARHTSQIGRVADLVVRWSSRTGAPPLSGGRDPDQNMCGLCGRFALSNHQAALPRRISLP